MTQLPCATPPPLLASDELEAAGLLPDRRAADFTERLNLLRVIAARGGSLDEMRAAAARGRLVTLAAELMVGPPAPCLTIADIAARSGLAAHDVRSLRQACRLTDPADQAVALSVGDLALVEAFQVASGLFGGDASMDFLRLVAASAARIADAAVTMFVTTAGASSLADDQQLVSVSRRTADLLDQLAPIIDLLVRQHLVQLARPNVTGDLSPFETRHESVGFVDLSGFTTLADEVPLHHLGQMLLSFERRATDAVHAHSGRLIKFVGDGAMYAAADPSAAARIALELVDASVDPTMPPVRAGIASGQVLVRDGDRFGPVVNVAARAVHVAAPRTVIVAVPDPGCTLDPDLRSTPVPGLRLRGVTRPVALSIVSWACRAETVSTR